MGRQYYLHRLALGRSAYEPEDATPPNSTEDQPSDGHYVQQFDSKGGPFNPEISAFNKTMRDAQNEALLLTGVVERKERTDRHEEIMRSTADSRRQSLLVDEHECGDLLQHGLIPISFFSHIWLESVIKRIQIGAYPPSLSLLSILTAEMQAISQPNQSIKLSLARRFPGLGDPLSQYVFQAPLVIAVEQLIGRIQAYAQSKRLSRTMNRRLYTLVSIAFEAILVLTDVALLPMEFYTTAQTLSLLPALPLFPSRGFFLSTGPHSFHSFGWKTTAFLTSPAILLCLKRFLRSETAEEGLPICSFLTTFRWPGLTDDPTLIAKPVVREDPLGWAMYQTWSMRTKVLQWFGWRIAKLNPRISAEGNLENDILLDEHNQLLRTASFHRSTALAHVPAQFLANAIDALFRKVITLPFESLMLRSVAFAFTGSSNSQSALSRRGFYAPFGGPLSRIGSPGGLAEVGTYASRLGLGILLNASLDLVLFFGVYKLVRRLGVERYGWGDGCGLQSSLAYENRARLELANRVHLDDVDD